MPRPPRAEQPPVPEAIPPIVCRARPAVNTLLASCNRYTGVVVSSFAVVAEHQCVHQGYSVFVGRTATYREESCTGWMKRSHTSWPSGKGCFSLACALLVGFATRRTVAETAGASSVEGSSIPFNRLGPCAILPNPILSSNPWRIITRSILMGYWITVH